MKGRRSISGKENKSKGTDGGLNLCTAEDMLKLQPGIYSSGLTSTSTKVTIRTLSRISDRRRKEIIHGNGLSQVFWGIFPSFLGGPGPFFSVDFVLF